MRKFAVILSLTVAAQLASAAGPIKVMLLDGEQGGPYHNWQETTPQLKKALDQAGLFDVEVVTAPPKGADFSQFKPEWKKYKVIVANYDVPDERWSDELKASFEDYMKNGGGLVAVHAADNAFPNWKAYNLMIGIGGWRGRTEKNGPYWYMKDGKLVPDTTPGPAGSHGARLPFVVQNRVLDHPITKGLPEKWMHVADELYAKMRGPGENMTVLASAYSDPSNKGTSRDEPILMVLNFGKGRIFHTVLGHDIAAINCVGFIATLQRGTEWAATGKVKQKVPADFPTAEKPAHAARLQSAAWVGAKEVTTRSQRMMDRRTLLKSAAGLLPAMAFAAPDWKEQIGLELYTIRDLLAKDFEGTIAKVAGIGYREVEPIGYGGLDPKAFRALLDKYKLSAPSTHGSATDGPDLEKELASHQTMGFEYTEIRAASNPGQRPPRTEETFKQAAARMNQHGSIARRFGMKLLYHNHSFEFDPLEGSTKTQYDVLLAETDADLVAMQLDIAWASIAGQNPLEMFNKNPGRFELWHVKDVVGLNAIDQSLPPSKRRGKFIPIGQGDIDYKPIFAAAKKAGMKCYVIEQDNAAEGGADSMAAAKANFDGLRKVLS